MAKQQPKSAGTTGRQSNAAETGRGEVRMIAGRFRAVRQVTIPLLKLKPNGAPYYIRCEGKMFVGRNIDIPGDQGKKKDPPWLMHILDLSHEPPSEAQIIVPAIMRKELDEQYPNASYVGKSFELIVTREKKEDGTNAKPYNHVGLTEIEVAKE